MSVAAAKLFDAQYAQTPASTLFTAASVTILDKVTATNTDAGSQTLTVYLVPNGGSPGGSNTIYSALSLTAGTEVDLTALQNQILAAGDSIQMLASVASKIVVRGSGRVIS